MSGENNISCKSCGRGKDFFGAAALFCLFVEIALAAWLFSGSSAEYSFPMFAAAVLCYAFCAFRRGAANHGMERLLNAVIILLGAVCVAQYFNPSAEQVVCERFSHLKSLDFIKFLPSSIKAEYHNGNVFSSFVNISAALCVFAAALSLLGDRRRLVAALSWLAANAVLMGIVACLQKAEKTPAIYGFHYTTADFFGSFPLSNAAGAYLNLATGVCAYLALAVRGSWRKKIFLAALWLCAAAFLSFAAYESGSKGAALANALFWAGFALIWLVKLSVLLSRRTSALFIAAAWACTAVLTAFALSAPSDIKAQAVKIAESKTVKESAISRLGIYSAVRTLVKERPYFGYGGGACAHVLPWQQLKKRDTSLAKPAAIAHRAHSDILEYAVDYGILGVAAILSILAAWVYCFAKNGRTAGQAALFLSATLCMAHSCIDMHLHIPSTMITLALVMAAAVEKDGRREL